MGYAGRLSFASPLECSCSPPALPSVLAPSRTGEGGAAVRVRASSLATFLPTGGRIGVSVAPLTGGRYRHRDGTDRMDDSDLLPQRHGHVGDGRTIADHS